MYNLFLKYKTFGSVYFFEKKIFLFNYVRLKKNSIFFIDKNVFLNLKVEERKKIKNFFLIESGENSKNMNNVKKILNFLIDNKYYKNTNVFSLGGGVTGDLIGFVSSIFYRGVNLIHIPTTVLSQCDSSIGGKNAVNSYSGKNLIGTIYHPKEILICKDFFYSLDNYYFLMGFSEIVKISLICEKNLFFYIKKNFKNILNKKPYVINFVLKSSIFYKFNIVKKDPLDKDFRFCLNLGHTFAHSIEVFENYSINHGEAVFFGLFFSCFFSYFLNFLKKKDLHLILETINLFYPNIKDKILKINFKKLINFIFFDKKRVSENFIKFVIIKHIGKICTKDLNLNILFKFFSFLRSELVN
ncbi:3-dehydroquinate synthase [Candidatus Vidania fulgoroideorum]